MRTSSEKSTAVDEQSRRQALGGGPADRQVAKARLRRYNGAEMMDDARMASRLDQCKLIDLPRIQDARGNLTAIEGTGITGFDIRRVYYLYDVPGGADRGGHAHKALYQLVIAMMGSFDITLDDGTDRRTFQLNRGYHGLLIRPYIWRELNNFSSGAVCLVLASELYDPADYFRDYNQFLAAARAQP